MTIYKYRSSVYRVYFLLLLTGITASMFCDKLAAQEKQIKEAAKTNTAISVSKRSNPYCGLYCIYTVIKLSGKQVDFSRLVKPEYLGSRKGSSLGELKKAAEDNGLYAESVANLTTRELRHSPYPIILHVKSEANSKDYDHFELFLGNQDGKARLINPPELMTIPFHQLAPQWDGTGLIVSSEPIDLGTVLAPSRKLFVIYAALGIAVILMVHWLGRRWLPSVATIDRQKLLALSTAQGAGLAATALLCGMLYHFANDEGFLAHADATASIQQAHLADFIPKVSKKNIQRLLNTDTVFIVARLTKDFQAAHLDGAISVPVDANDQQRRKALANVDKNAHIVVYCQSVGCKFAESVAIKLRDDGYSDVSIFKGGWQQWEAKKDG